MLSSVRGATENAMSRIPIERTRRGFSFSSQSSSRGRTEFRAAFSASARCTTNAISHCIWPIWKRMLRVAAKGVRGRWGIEAKRDSSGTPVTIAIVAKALTLAISSVLHLLHRQIEPQLLATIRHRTVCSG